MAEPSDATRHGTDSVPAKSELSSEAEAEAILGKLASLFLNGTAPSITPLHLHYGEGHREGDKEGPEPTPEGMYRVLVEQIPAVIFVGYLDRRVGEAYVSPQIELALGFSQEEWLEDPIRWYQQIHPDDKQRWSVDAAQMFLSGEPLKSIYRVIAKDGRVVWFQCEAKMVRREDGQPWFIHGVGFDISELKRTEEALQKGTKELRDLSSRLLRAQDEERRRIARELHDSLGQYLAGLKMTLALIRQGGARSTDERWSESDEILERCITETRTLSHLLHPPLLDEMGLISAAQWYIEGFASRSGIKVTTDIDPNLGRLPQSVETALFRVLQECLTNIHRHSGSQGAEVRLGRNNVEIFLEVRDHGQGMSSTLVDRFGRKRTEPGVGLSGMRERVSELAGKLEISSGNHGTLVRVTVPV